MSLLVHRKELQVVASANEIDWKENVRAHSAHKAEALRS